MDRAEQDADESLSTPPPTTSGGTVRPEPGTTDQNDAESTDKDTDTDMRRSNDAGDDSGNGNSQGESRLNATRLSSMATHNGRDIAEMLRQHDHDSIDGNGNGTDAPGMQVGDIYTQKLENDDTPNGDSDRASSAKKGTRPGRANRGSDSGGTRSRSGSGDSKGVVSFLGNLSPSVDGDSISGSSAGRIKGLTDNGRSKDRRGSRCSVDSALSDTTRTSTATTRTDAFRNVWTKLMRKDDAWDDIDDLDSEYGGGYSSGVNGVGEHITEAVVGAWGWTTHTFRVACKTPSILLATLLVFAIFCAATVSLVVKFTDDEEDARLAVAREMAEETGLFFSRELDKALVPLFTMSQFVYQLPAFADLPRIIGDRGDPGAVPPEDGPRAGSHRNMTGVVSPELWDMFNTIAAGIKKSADMEGVLVNVQLAPQAVVSMAYPLNNTEDFEDGVFLNSNGAIGHDLLNDPNRVAIARATVPAPGVVIAGPLTLIQGDFPVVRECFIARLAINMPGATPPYDIKVDGISYESWGFAVVLINWEALKDRSNVYERFNQRGMFFQLTRTDQKFDSDTNTFVERVNVIAQSPGAEERHSWQLGDVVDVALPTTNNEWVMTVGYEDGSRPSTEKWAIPLAVIGSLLVAYCDRSRPYQLCRRSLCR